MKTYLSLIFFFLLAGATNAETVTISGFELDYRLQADGQGHYHQLLQALNRHGVDFSLEVLPMARAVRTLLTDAPGCVFPASLNALTVQKSDYDVSKLIASHPVDAISLRVFTRPEDPKIHNLSELKDKRVAFWNGLKADVLLANTGAILESTPNESTRVRMLAAHRLDVIIGFTPDVLLVSDTLQLPLPGYDEELALMRDEGASLVCGRSPEHNALIDQFNRALTTLRKSGELRKILGPHADIVEPETPRP